MPSEIWSQESSTTATTTSLDLSIHDSPHSTSTTPFTENIHLKPIPSLPKFQQQKNTHGPPEPKAPYHHDPSTPSSSPDNCQCSVYFSDPYSLRPKSPLRSSLVLANTGNLARDHLSIERTWLSYMRTGLLIACTGVGIVQCFALTTAVQTNHARRRSIHVVRDMDSGGWSSSYIKWSAMAQRFARPLGMTIVLLALIVHAIGILRYFKVQKALLQGIFPAMRLTAVLLSATITVLIGVTLSVILALP